MTQDSIFVTHARTINELRDEFVSDIHRRLVALDLEQKYEKRVSKSMAIARAKLELENVLDFWLGITLRGAPNPKPKKEEIAHE